MAETEARSLAELLFGPTAVQGDKSEEDLAEVISAWFRAMQTQVHDGARFGTPSAEALTSPRRAP